MVTENQEAIPELPPLITSAPAHIRLSQKQRQALIFLALAVPLWIVLSVLAIADRIVMLTFIGGLFLLVVIFGMRTEYLLFLWLITQEFNQMAKWVLRVHLLGVGIKGIFFAAVLSQLPAKFSLMPRRLFRSVPVRWPVYLLLMWTAASIFWSDYPIYGLNRYLTWVMAFIFYALVFLTINDQNKRLFFIMFAVVTGLSVLLGFAQGLGLGTSFPTDEALGDRRIFTSQWHTGTGGLMFRASGLAGHPNTFGRECALFFCVLMMMLISWRPRPVWRLVILGFLAMTIVTIVITMSRVAWGYFIVGTVAFLFFARRRWLVPFGVLTGIIVLIALPQILERIQPILEGNDPSVAARMYASDTYLEYWRMQPITGFGLGSTGGGALFKCRTSPHEGYVFLLSYLGLIGLFLYIFLVVALLRKALRVTRDRLVQADPELRAMAALGFSLAAVMALNFVVSVEFHQNVWYLLGATMAAPRIARNRMAQAEIETVENGLKG